MMRGTGNGPMKAAAKPEEYVDVGLWQTEN